MVTQEAKSSPAPTAQEIANKFVGSYYDMLLKNPEVVHKFYEDKSSITRPNLEDEVMSSASTMEGIKNKILSVGYHMCPAEIESVDALKSCNNGIIVLVTGFLIGEDEMKKSFAQTFFLAPHETGYFVLNDIFKFGMVIDEAVDITAATEVAEIHVPTPLTEEMQVKEPKVSAVTIPETDYSYTDNIESFQEPVQQAEVKQPEPEVQQSEVNQSESVTEKVTSNSLAKSLPSSKSSIDKKGPVLKEVVSKQSSTLSTTQTQEPPKASYASILAKVSPVSSPVKRLANPVVVVAASANSYLDKVKPKAALPQQTPTHQVKPKASLHQQATHHLNNASASGINNGPPSYDNYNNENSIYVGCLPPKISAEEIENVFSEFGSVRKDKIRVTSFEDGFCYAFVEFESSDAARKAIEKRDFDIGMHKSYATEKRSSVRGGNGNNTRQASGKGEYRNNDNYRRSRENSVEGRTDQNGYRGDYGQNRETFNNKFQNRNDSQYQNRWTNENSGQNRWRNGCGELRVQQNGGSRQAPTTGIK